MVRRGPVIAVFSERRRQAIQREAGLMPWELGAAGNQRQGRGRDWRGWGKPGRVWPPPGGKISRRAGSSVQHGRESEWVGEEILGFGLC